MESMEMLSNVPPLSGPLAGYSSFSRGVEKKKYSTEAVNEPPSLIEALTCAGRAVGVGIGVRGHYMQKQLEHSSRGEPA
jgi:hypothetical protein